MLRTAESARGIERVRQCGTCGTRWATLEAPRDIIDRAAEIIEAFKAMQRVIPQEE